VPSFSLFSDLIPLLSHGKRHPFTTVEFTLGIHRRPRGQADPLRFRFILGGGAGKIKEVIKNRTASFLTALRCFSAREHTVLVLKNRESLSFFNLTTKKTGSGHGSQAVIS
jgi:hypothetical protein